MKKLTLIAFVWFCFVVSAHAQGPVFDNFDTARGVEVLTPPTPPAPRLFKKRNALGKWVVVTEDKLVRKTAQTRPATGPADGLATRGTPAIKLAMGSNIGLKGFTTGDATVDAYVVDSSRRYAIDPLLIYSQMHQESTFKLRAISPKGARGLMQLMPDTARRMGVANIYDPKQNIEGGVKYMRFLLDMFNGDVNLALAGYNAGENAVLKYGNQVPPYRETLEYVRRISERYNMISNPQYIQSARRVSGELASKLEQKKTRPLSMYEPGVLTIRLPDGKLTLVNQ
ncbi:MAG TPA: lytic transglycosylase domain-containing protein [Pyrinomonadaceae bacterium]|nr:lytic transglycosylase domain-containing protein [Pyrinomonadaceae bacterium]